MHTTLSLAMALTASQLVRDEPLIDIDFVDSLPKEDVVSAWHRANHNQRSGSGSSRLELSQGQIARQREQKRKKRLAQKRARKASR